MSLARNQISNRSFRVVPCEAESWDSQHVVNNVLNGECGIDFVLGRVCRLGPGILLLADDFKVASKAAYLTGPLSQLMHVSLDVFATTWESLDV